jgi:hypothetical protein
MSQSQGISSQPRQSAPLSKQLFAVIISTVAAITANVILYFFFKNLVGIEFIAPEQYPPPEVSPLPVTDVIIFSTLFSAGAALIFLFVANTVRKPAQVFVAISIIVLVGSFYLPLRIPTPPVPMSTKLALASMHILGAVVLVPLLVGIGLSNRINKLPSPRRDEI